jgi:hypothetical protein
MAETLPTYYDVLQVERHASPDRIRMAYRRLAQKYHPDKMPGNANAVRAMAAINAAYEVLGNQQQRADHDRWITRAESRPMPLHAPPVETAWTFFNPVTGWPWYLLFSTMLVAIGTIMTALYLTAMPARATSTAAVAAAPPCPLTGPATQARCRR